MCIKQPKSHSPKKLWLFGEINKIISTGTVVSSDTYAYTDTSWSDKLTSFNSQPITYDAMGNPLSYKGATLTWNGRLLMSYEKGSEKFTYTYDADGLRTSKTKYLNNNAVFKESYIWSGQTLISAQRYEYATGTTSVMKYLYDSNGEIYGFTYNGETYLYVKNLQGDVDCIISAVDNLLCVGYIYDPWGDVYAITDEEATAEELAIAEEIIAINNITYRGYFYDSETGLYYLQSRYYDPEIGRFINADDIEMIKPIETPTCYFPFDTYLNANVFAYCDNCPIVKSDPDGQASRSELGNSIASALIISGLVDVAYKSIEISSGGTLSVNNKGEQYFEGGKISVNFLSNEFYTLIDYLYRKKKNIDVFKIIAATALEKFKEKYKYIHSNGTYVHPYRDFLFNDKCVKKEIEDHFLGLMWCLGNRGYFLPYYMTLYCWNNKIFSVSGMKERIFKACEQANIAEHSVVMNPNEAKVYNYKKNIRDKYKKTKADPYYDIATGKRWSDVQGGWRYRREEKRYE